MCRRVIMGRGRNRAGKTSILILADLILAGSKLEGSSFRDLFGQFFGGRRGGVAAEPEHEPGGDLEYQIEIDFWDAVRGSVKKLQITRMDTCETCHGTGAVGTPQTCPTCNGTGSIQQTAGKMRFNVPCNRCGGTGKLRTPCRVCGGEGRVRKTETIDVRIPPGVANGGRVRVPGKGNAGTMGAPAGDLYLRVVVQPHEFFERRGNDLYTKVPVTVAEASLGAKIEVPTIDGRSLVRIPPGTNSGRTLATERKRRAARKERGARRPVRGDSDCRAGTDGRARAHVHEGTGRGCAGRSAEGFVCEGRSVETPCRPKARKRAKAGYMISAVAELYKLHPQTLRLYERVGLLKPSRSQGNTRLYTDSDLERLEVILTLARDMGVNLAGIEIILNMREKMIEMEHVMGEFAQVVQQELSRMASRTEKEE